MSDFTDDLDLYEEDWLSNRHDYEWDGDCDYIPVGLQLDKTCRYCGKGRLRWGFDKKTGWQLYEPNCKGLHVCDFTSDFTKLKPLTPKRK
jgi:hypothetical protein